tara:strand:- start:179 stop:463 length:285 start_codon:yes stop_codon:yes gene_type:complete
MNNTQENAFADCLDRASHFTTLAEFIKDRCSRFTCLCIHEGCKIHVYDELEAHLEFGADGWTRGDDVETDGAPRSTSNWSKQVGPVTVSYWRKE